MDIIIARGREENEEGQGACVLRAIEIDELIQAICSAFTRIQ